MATRGSDKKSAANERWLRSQAAKVPEMQRFVASLAGHSHKGKGRAKR